MKKTRLVLLLFAFVLFFSILPQKGIAQTPPTCAYNPYVEDILSGVTQNDVTQWIRDFSGEDFVTIAGNQRKILTRSSYQMFGMNLNAMAYPYLGYQLAGFGYIAGTNLTDHNYSPWYLAENKENLAGEWIVANDKALLTSDKNIAYLDQTLTWKNKVVTIPGHGPNADEIVLMTAHMDSTSYSATTNAPGAEDNASGIAALMEAARLFRFYQFDRTIKIIFFTGEEQGLWGSEAYVADNPAEMPNIVGVVNLDMFGYDSNDDRCFELHVGTRTDSNMIGTCFTTVIDNYDLNLSYDYITSGAIGASDHASFWAADVGAIEVLENYSTHTLPGGCVGADMNPHYHETTDRIQYMNLPVTHAITQAGIGTTASLAGPMGTCFASDPQITATPQADSILLTWPEIADADVYTIYRSSTSCTDSFTQIAQVSTNNYQDTAIELDTDYFYKVQAAETGAICFSQLSNCASARVEVPVFFAIFIPLVIAGD